MRDDIIRAKLDKVNIKYKETKKSFIIPKEEVMSNSKEPKWFTEFRKEFIEFKKENDARWEKQFAFNENQLKFNELLLSLPTIKKEINELKK